MNPQLTARVALFGLAWAGTSALGVLVHVCTTLLLGDPADLLGFPFLVHALTCLVPLLVWLLCRVPRSTAFCRVVDAAGLIVSAVALALMGRTLAQLNTPSPAGAPVEMYARLVGTIYEALTQLVMFASTLMFMLRSALVPSRTGHTVGIGVAMGAAMFAVLVPGYHPPAGGEPAPYVDLVLSTGLSWLVAVAVCGALSAIIHGLHQEIEKARKLGQYTLEEPIGEGGMGTVYRARHAMLRRPTAVKLLRRERAGDEAIQRFEREVQLTAQLTHPNTITIYDYGRTPDDVFYYAMELLDGATLQSIVDADGPQPAERVVRVLRMVAGALSEAHGRGLIHRDIKPANIVLSERGGVRDVATVLDFGLVREIDGGADPGLTFDGKIVGTPMYLAPEVIRANVADARSDLYAVGAVGYFMLTGHTVFEGKTVVEVCGHHLHSPVLAPSRRLEAPVDAGLEALILRCLAKEPAERPESAHALIAALDALSVGARPSP